MGWSYGIVSSGKEVGYGVGAVCEEPECGIEIDRGLAYVCGIMHGDNCGGYYCYRHLSMNGKLGQACARCLVDKATREEGE